MDTTQWPQDTSVLKPMEEVVVGNNNNNNNTSICSIKGVSLEKKARPTTHEKGLNCPRCNSTSTKFCYYNNYSLTQPRYFCKTCKRYWTQGGTLRSIPVGGGSRKNKRSSSSVSTSSSSKKINDLDLVNPKKINYLDDEGRQDLNLGFSKTSQDFKTISELIQVPNFDNYNSTKKESFSALELINNGISTRGFSSFFPMVPIGSGTDPAIYNLMPADHFKPPSLNFSLEGLVGNGGGGGVYGSLLQDVVQETSGMLLFPFEDLKQVSGTTNTNDHIDQQQNRDQNGDSNGFWNGVLGGGSW